MQGRQKSELKNQLYVRLQAGFSEWLRILNFEPSSRKDMPKMLTEFLSYLEAKGCNQLTGITESHIESFLNFQSTRPNKLKAGSLSLNYLRKYLQVIRKFSRYLAESGQESFTADVKLKGRSSNIKSILNKAEVNQLYEAAAEDVLGLRDRAMLALYYGCGLRKNEGIALNTNDILLDKELVYVRKGKGYKERYVPLTGKNKTELETYLTYSRPYLACGRRDSALLLTHNGKRLTGGSAFDRMQQLRKKAEIKKATGLHTLRHSIATHLLQSGMKLEQIQTFLGHTSLESTQIYTHIANDF
jgi:site-specific recombinase XerD